MNASKSLLACILVAGMATAKADVKLPSIFSEHMVLLKAAAVPVWGKADPGEPVSVSFQGKTLQATAGADGKWKVLLDLKDSPAGPFEMTVAGKNRLSIPDVLVGQTWLASGQSNMERTLGALAKTDDIARSTDPLLRQFRVTLKGADTPQDDCQGVWTVADPKTAGNFTAVGYYFAKKLRAELQQPVALINVSWGGTQVESWLSREAIAKDATLAEGAAAVAKSIDEYPAQKAAFVKGFGDWLKANSREDKPTADAAAYAGPTVATADWTPVELPGKIAGPNLPANGVIWLRKEVDVPEGAQVQSINGALGQIVGFESVYWNGKRISETTYQKFLGEGVGRDFGVPQADVHPGKAILAIRIYAPVLPPAITTDRAHFIAGPISISGEWLAKAKSSLPALPPAVLATVPQAPRNPPQMKASNIYNGVVHPVIPYGLAGILWYQGESNAGIGYQYRTSFPLLIDDMREQWGDARLPFYFCQLPVSGPKTSLPSAPSAWADLRESQSLALRLPETGEAVLIDTGEAQDIHPRDKLTPGGRLANIALALKYGRQIVYSGPVYQSMAVEGSKIRVRFAHADGGLAARPLPKTYDIRRVVNQTAPLVPNSPGSQVEGFALCGEDHQWVWANAIIQGDSVVVSADQVAHPVAVRYAWADNPTCNLCNAADLPAAPFRSDDFPVTTQNGRFGLPPARK